MTIAAIFLPLLGAFIAGFFGRWIGNRGSQVVTCAGVGIAAIYAVVLFVQVALDHHDLGGRGDAGQAQPRGDFALGRSPAGGQTRLLRMLHDQQIEGAGIA